MPFLSAFWQRECSRFHLHWFWLPVIFYFILGIQYYQANMGGTGTDLPINLVGWAFFSLSLSMGMWRLYQTQKVKVNRFISFMGLVLVALYVPFLFGNAHPQPSTWFLFLAIPLVWLFLLFSLQFRVTQQTRFILVAAIVIGTTSQLIIAIAQLTIMEHTKAPFGHFQQVNLLGSFIITGYACLFYLWICHPNTQNNYVLMCFGAISLLTGWHAIQLESRSTLIEGIAVSVLCLIYLLYTRRYKPLLFIVCFAAGLGLTQLPDKQEMSATTSEPVAAEIDERKILYPQVFRLISDNLLTGVGYGNFESAYTRYAAIQAQQEGRIELIRHNMAHPHNELLFWFTEGGIIAGVAAIMALLAILFWLIRQQWPDAPVIFSLFIPIGAHNLIEYPLQTSLPHLLVLLVLIRLFVIPGQTKQISLPSVVTSGLRPLALVMSLFAITFSLTGLHTIHLVLQYELAAVKTPAPYLRIVNPFVHYDRYWTNIMAHKAMVAVDTDNRKAMQEYIDWAENAIRHHPRKVYFENIIRLKGYLETLEKSDCERYEFYFPEQRCTDLLSATPKT